MRILPVLLLLLMPSPAAALPARTNASKFVRAIDDMMVALGPQSLHASKAIRKAYGPQLDLLGLDEYAELAGALESGRLAPLPADPLRFNLAPRLEGPHPIGEKDLHHQHSYIAARPATIGLLIEIASRVKSGPLEITSLVRHGEYQDSLRSTNANANTGVPMHTIAILPTDEFANEWWIGDDPVHDHDAIAATVSAPVLPPPAEDPVSAGTLTARVLMLLAGLLTTVWRIPTQRRASPPTPMAFLHSGCP